MPPKTIKIDNVEHITKTDAEALVKKTAKIKNTTQDHPYVKGEFYHVETATKYYVGDCAHVTDNELILDNAAWIPSTGRMHKYMLGEGPEEMEPLNGPVFIGRGAIVAVLPIKRIILAVK